MTVGRQLVDLLSQIGVRIHVLRLHRTAHRRNERVLSAEGDLDGLVQRVVLQGGQ